MECPGESRRRLRGPEGKEDASVDQPRMNEKCATEKKYPRETTWRVTRDRRDKSRKEQRRYYSDQEKTHRKKWVGTLGKKGEKARRYGTRRGTRKAAQA